jgi:hypothetical protein
VTAHEPAIALIAAAKRAGDITRLVEAVPYARFMGISAVHVDGELLGRLQFAEHLIGNPMLPAMHGGVIGRCSSRRRSSS